MRQITFSDTDVQAIAHERYHPPDPQVQRHLEILWLKHHDFPPNASRPWQTVREARCNAR